MARRTPPAAKGSAPSPLGDLEDWTARFEVERPRLRGLAFRMLGSLADADDVVQEAGLRLMRVEAKADAGGTGAIADLPAWLTTVTARLALDALRSRRRRREEPLGPVDGAVPEAPAASFVATRAPGPEEEMILAEALGLALLVMLDRLRPAERLAFVLHDAFGMPFAQVAAILGRSPEATRQAASRARKRVRGAPPDPAMRADRAVVAAFARAAHEGDLPALMRILDPDVTLHLDPTRLPPGAPAEVKGAGAVAGRARMGAMRRAGLLVLVSGRPALAVAPGGRLELVMTFAVRNGRVLRIEVIAEPARLIGLPLTLFEPDRVGMTPHREDAQEPTGGPSDMGDTLAIAGNMLSRQDAGEPSSRRATPSRSAALNRENPMYGLINRLGAHPGQRDALIAAMTSDMGALPGCRSFVVARDPKDPDAVWITEVWDSRAAWAASMELPGVKAAIAVAMPLIGGFGEPVETEVVAGYGF